MALTAAERKQHYKERHPERFRAQNVENLRRLRELKPGYYNKYNDKANGIDHEKAEAIRESYLACMICGSDKRLVVDHNHSTGKIRGRLCDECNKGVGCFKDSPFFLKRAADYLENA